MLDRVKEIARGRTRNLVKKNVGVTKEEAVGTAVPADHSLKDLGRQFQDFARHLDERLAGRHPSSQQHRDPGHAVAPMTRLPVEPPPAPTEIMAVSGK
jgi:hypothetical protein